MIRLIEVPVEPTLDDYAAHLHLMQAVVDLRNVTEEAVRALRGRAVWMVNSTAEGGGVAEMLPKVVALLREVGIDARWIVVGGDKPGFFKLTKRLHNLLHGEGDPSLGAEERALYESVSRAYADALQERVTPGDVLVVHDPQPLGVGALLKERLGMPALWRCHIGLDIETPATQAAWDFLAPWARAYDAAIFSLPDYVPAFLQDRAQIIHPAIDPLSDKNRVLNVRRVAGILNNASLDGASQPVVPPPFDSPAMRLQGDGTFAPAHEPDSIGLLYRPIVLQVSRWDRLKGFGPLLEGFARLKQRLHAPENGLTARHRRRLELVRLVLAGPDPSSVQDDPEGLEVFEELCETWLGLDPEVQRDAVVLVLPMGSRRENALMVNALQRCATVVAQNSLREGFGLTVSEAMWKGCPVLGSRAAGIRSQVRDGTDGRLVHDPEDPEEVADVLDEMLVSPERRTVWGRNAQRRVAEHYLVFAQVRRWLEVLSAQVHEASYR